MIFFEPIEWIEMDEDYDKFIDELYKQYDDG